MLSTLVTCSCLCSVSLVAQVSSVGICINDFHTQLTHGLTEKEAFHKKGYENVDFNESVKTKTKEYIRNYMKKFGPIYTRT